MSGHLSRRDVLGLLAAAGAAAAFGSAGLLRSSTASAQDAPPAEGPPLLVVLVLRGGLDGLHALVPYGDPHYERAREALALDPDALAVLDDTFSLHPGLAPLAPWFAEGALLPLHAVGIPYRDRSHFDGQDVLEGGGTRPGQLRQGWLGRTLARIPEAQGIALGKTVPLTLRGAGQTLAIDPDRTRAAHTTLLERLEAMYASDPELLAALCAGRDSLALLPDTERGRDGLLPSRATGAAGRIATLSTGPTAVVVELGGWDTHDRQAGQLQNRLAGLAGGLVGLRRELGPAWARTVVAAVTEFGRTVAPNGTGGTDHGVGAAALLAGGALAGGRVLADWPGLGPRERLEGRDLRPTTDLRGVLAGLARDHLGLQPAHIGHVFPGLGDGDAVDGLIRSG